MDLHALGRQAVALHQQGRLADAEALYRQILAADAGVYPALYLLATLRLQAGDSAEAVTLLERALALNPHDPAANLHYGLALQGQLRFADAFAPLERALAAAPGNPVARLARATGLRVQNRNEEALQDYEAVLAGDRGNADAWNGRGLVLRKLGRIQEAELSFGQAITLMPAFAEALDNRAHLRMDKRAYQAALEDLEQVKRLAPARTLVDSNIAHLRMLMAIHDCDWDQAARIEADLPEQVARQENISPFMLLQFSADEMLQLAAARNQIALSYAPAPALHAPRRSTPRPIRLGYLSSDFRDHAVSAQLVEVVERHDRGAFQTLGLATGPGENSPMRRRIAQAFHEFVDFAQVPRDEITRRIAALELDLLIDLNGHTQNGNYDILRHRPAPVQAGWLGYAGTSGAPYIDYLVADAVVAPNPQAFSETVLRMPFSFFPCDTTRPLVAPPSRASQGLPQDAMVFCCFNHHWKFTAPVFDTWLRLLQQVPGSVLWMRAMPPVPLARLQQRAQDAGVDPARLVPAMHVNLDLHLARHACADLFLDTAPYNAHATASDALYAGLPVLTTRGTAFAGRVAASLLEATGLPELIAADLADYEARALALARDPTTLAQLRARLIEGRAATPLFDMARFTRDLEALYRSMLAG